MKRLTRLALGASAVLGLSAFAVRIAAGADGSLPGPIFGGGGERAVFVQTDNVAGNQVVVYDRGANGSLTLVNTYDTGGMGGVLNGSVVDHLGSQGSLTYDPRQSLLYAVNAGSNSVSVFSVRGDDLTLRQVVSSRWNVPRQRGGAWLPRLCPQRPKRRIGAGVFRHFRPPFSCPGIKSKSRLDDPYRHHAVHPHAGTGCSTHRRFETARHDQGQLQCH